MSRKATIRRRVRRPVAGAVAAGFREKLSESYTRHSLTLTRLQGVNSAEAADARSRCCRVLADIASVELSLRTSEAHAQ